MFCGGREKNSTCIRTHCICTKMAILSKAMYQYVPKGPGIVRDTKDEMCCATSSCFFDQSFPDR